MAHENNPNNTIGQNNGALKSMLIINSMLEQISIFILTMAGKATAWNAAGGAAKTAVDGS